METKKQRKIFNIIMVAVIVLIIAAGIVWAGSMKGWFSGGDDSFATASSVTGVVNVERNGVSFELEEGASLQPGDKITTNSKAQMRISAGKNTFTMAENTTASVNERDDGKITMSLGAGEIFAVLNDGEKFGQVSAMDTVINADGTVAGIKVTEASETPGLGAKAQSDKNWIAQFAGQPADGSLAVSKDGGTINAITGATITSRAVTLGVNTAANCVASLG